MCFPCDWDPVTEDPYFPFMYFRVVLVHSISFIFTLYCSQHYGTVMFDKIAEKIYKSLSDNPSTFILAVTSIITKRLISPFNQNHWKRQTLSWLLYRLWSYPDSWSSHSYSWHNGTSRTYLSHILPWKNAPLNYYLPRPLYFSWCQTESLPTDVHWATFR